MKDDKKVLAIVPARGGSKGLPRKNILPLCGKPLIVWTIEAARGSVYIDDVVVSTDDEEIVGVCEEYGCEVPYLRPAEIAGDTASAISVVEYVLERESERGNEYGMVVYLQPTSPLRTSSDIDACIVLAGRSAVGACVSVTESNKHPRWMFTVGADGVLEPFLGDADIALRRQDLEAVYSLNGAVYAVLTESFALHRALVVPGSNAYVMPKKRSVDIDDREDFQYAQFLMSETHDCK